MISLKTFQAVRKCILNRYFAPFPNTTSATQANNKFYNDIIKGRAFPFALSSIQALCGSGLPLSNSDFAQVGLYCLVRRDLTYESLNVPMTLEIHKEWSTENSSRAWPKLIIV